LIEVKNEIVNEVESVANNDEGQLVRKFGLLEEVLDLLRVVVVAFATNSLHLSDLTSASGSLDILEVDFGVLAEIDDVSKVIVETLRKGVSMCHHSQDRIVQTFISLERFEHLNQLDRTEDI
jgi:hypothetical protein